MPEDAIQFEQAIWTDVDFDRMGWHDVALHAIAIEPALPYPGRLSLDIDYIVKWEPPAPPAADCTFWLCPATLVFDHASDLVVELTATNSTFEPSLNEITRTDPDSYGYRTWTLEGHEFTVKLRSPGFVQYMRRPPLHYTSQRMSLRDRGGLSFDERAFS